MTENESERGVGGYKKKRICAFRKRLKTVRFVQCKDAPPHAIDRDARTGFRLSLLVNLVGDKTGVYDVHKIYVALQL